MKLGLVLAATFTAISKATRIEKANQDPELDGLDFLDDHFSPYSSASPTYTTSASYHRPTPNPYPYQTVPSQPTNSSPYVYQPYPGSPPLHAHVHQTHYEPPPNPIYYAPTDDYTGHGPVSDYEAKVENFDLWETIWDQEDYEIRLEDEADLMIALEALRENVLIIEDLLEDLWNDIGENAQDIE